MSQMQRYLTEVLGLNYVIKPNKSAVVSLAADVMRLQEEPAVTVENINAPVGPVSSVPVHSAKNEAEKVVPKLKVEHEVKSAKAQPKVEAAPKKLSLDKIPDIQIRINPKAKILFLVPDKIKKQENEVLHNISKACHPRPVILVNSKQLKNKSYVKELSESNISHGFCFGAEPFKAVSKDSFFDYFKKQADAFGLKWLATHSLEKLSEKSESLTTYKKETWTQLQELFKETQ